MNKAVVYTGIGLGVAVIGYFAYKFMQEPSQAYSPTSANPYSQPNFTTNPYQTYPFVANTPPRVDNSNQPWANNNRAALNGVSTPQMDVNISNTQMLADILKSGRSIIDSGKSIWSDVSSWFDSGDADWTMTDWSSAGESWEDSFYA